MNNRQHVNCTVNTLINSKITSQHAMYALLLELTFFPKPVQAKERLKYFVLSVLVQLILATL